MFSKNGSTSCLMEPSVQVPKGTVVKDIRRCNDISDLPER